MTNTVIKVHPKHSLIFSCLFMLTACVTPSEVPLGQTELEWDFDHKLQFKKTKFDDNHYQLEVVTAKKLNFQRMSAFLLRRSQLICGGYGYTLTMVKGVEGVDDKRSSPNKIRSNLVAKIECPVSS